MIDCYAWDGDCEVTRTREGHSPHWTSRPVSRPSLILLRGLETNPVRGFAQGLGELAPCSLRSAPIPSQERSCGLTQALGPGLPPNIYSHPFWLGGLRQVTFPLWASSLLLQTSPPELWEFLISMYLKGVLWSRLWKLAIQVSRAHAVTNCRQHFKVGDFT